MTKKKKKLKGGFRARVFAIRPKEKAEEIEADFKNWCWENGIEESEYKCNVLKNNMEV